MRLDRGMKLLGVGLGLAAGGLAALAYRAVLLPLPKRAGRVNLPDLGGTVETRWDRWGVPHVYATTLHDLFLMQGYFHAQDRLWQMELNRRAGSGRLSEVFGDRTLEVDRFMRRVGLHRAAEEELRQLDDEVAGLLAGYCRGVNAFLRRHRNRLPLEFTLLRYRPEPWRPVDTLQWVKLMGRGLASNWDAEIYRGHFAAMLGADFSERLQHAYPPGHPLAAAPGEMEAGTNLDAEDPLLAAAFIRGGFSNAWAVDGSRTASGKPLLANDPHLSPQLPSPYYEMHLECPGFRVAGVTLPGAPGIVIGHNEQVAWGITASMADTEDAYEIEFSPEDPASYRYDGGWRKAGIVPEFIRVKGSAAAIREDVLITHHGPVVLPKKDAPNRAFTLRSTALERDSLLRAGLDMARAQTAAEFRSALAHWGAPSVNFVFAAAAGDIGYQLAGLLPNRPVGSGFTPALGSAKETEWLGYVPFEALPHVISPAAGAVVSANNKPGPTETAYPSLIAGEWADGFRAQRIWDRLAETPHLHLHLHSIDSFRQMHQDAVSNAAKELQDLLKDAPPDSFVARRYWRDFMAWDGALTAGSREGALYEAFRYQLYRNLLTPVLGERVNDFFGVQLHPLGASAAFQARGSSFLIAQLRALKQTGRANGSFGRLITRSFEGAVADLTRRLGADDERWSWGRLHQVTFRHALGRGPLLSRLLNRGPFPAPGDGDTPHQASFSFATPYEANRWLPTFRFIADTADWDRCVSVQAPGQSGQCGDPHYADQLRLWRNAQYHPMPFSRDSVEACATRVQRFLPL